MCATCPYTPVEPNPPCPRAVAAQLVRLFHADGQERCDDHLRDLHAGLHVEAWLPVIDQYHTNLATIPVIDRAWRIQHGDAMLQRKAAAGPHLRLGVRRQLDGNARADQLAFARLDRDRNGRIEIEPGVSRMPVSGATSRIETVA